MSKQHHPPEHARLRRDFRVFLCLIWRHLGVGDPTPAQYDIARYIQTGPRRKMVMAFRGVGKSWIYSAYVCWRLWGQPDAKILIVSAGKGQAEAVSSFSRRLIDETPLLHGLRPSRKQRDGAALFDVGPARAAKDPSVRAVGITGQITGGRADEILADDVETASNALTAAARAKLREAIKEFDAVLRPGGRITYLGTPQTAESIYEALPDRGYRVRVWPAEVPEDPGVYRGRLAPFVRKMMDQGAPPGAPIDPARFTAEDLAARRASYGPSGYAMQFLLDARARDGERRPLKLSDLVVLPLRPGLGPNALIAGGDVLADLRVAGGDGAPFHGPLEVAQDWAPFDSAVMAIDPAGRGGDETAYAVVKHLNGRLFVTASGGLEGGYEDAAMAHLAEIAALQAPQRILIEANFGDGMFAKMLGPWLLRRGLRAAVGEIRASLRKELRLIETLEPVMAQRRLIVDRAVVEMDFANAAADPGRSLFGQMARLTRTPGALGRDDRLDALAMAVGAFAEQLRRDVDAAAEATRAKRMQAELRAIRTPLGAERRAKSSKRSGGGARKW
ncbi:MAG: phage terminase large subunit [Neomegalonema sp.]|nr:phage terminase large subunit [Neomegalonema sp.]